MGRSGLRRALTDFLSKAERSLRMSRIRGKNTKPEVSLRKKLHRLGLRYRLHVTSLPGKPDIVLSKYRAVVFVHGCFWHHHQDCKVANDPKSNSEFWQRKFEANITRDRLNEARLVELGWRVFVVWECEVTLSRLEATVDALANKIKRDI